MLPNAASVPVATCCHLWHLYCFLPNKARSSSPWEHSPWAAPQVLSSLTPNLRRHGDPLGQVLWNTVAPIILAHVQGVTVATQGKPAEGVRVCHARWSSALVAHTWGRGGAWQRKDGVLPGSIKAVVRADRVVPEELLAAVCTRLCTEMEEKHRLEKSGSLDAGTTRGWPGLSSV